MPYFHPVTPETPFRKKITYYKGTTFKFQNQSQDDNGNPYDFTGHTFQLLVKENAGDADVDALVTIPDGSFTLSASSDGDAAGVSDIYDISHDPADFDDLVLSPFKHFYVLQVTDAAGNTFNHYLGEWEVKAD